MSDSDYVIWSFEHLAWWRPGGFGYTPNLEEAGSYSRAEAEAIVARANIVKVNEEMMTRDAAPDRMRADPRLWVRLAPGVYDDHVGGLHLKITELLGANGYPDTPENRATLLEVAQTMFGKALVIEEDERPDERSD